MWLKVFILLPAYFITLNSGQEAGFQWFINKSYSSFKYIVLNISVTGAHIESVIWITLCATSTGLYTSYSCMLLPQSLIL